MCGIAGQFNRDERSPSVALVRRLTTALAHRGPDGTGLHFDQHAALGHQRLAFVDIANGHQPFGDEQAALWITFNGEIYNHRELRRDLIARGARFRANHEAEVVLRLYETEGESGFARLDGMYAIAIWDRRRRRLVLARDPFGIKPLHYYESDRTVLFASELRALLHAREIPRRIDQEALAGYLADLCVSDPKSIFLDIRKVDPGHAIAFERQGSRRTRFWTPPARKPTTERAAKRALRAALAASVQAALEAETPVGLFLSGGIDSSCLAALGRARGELDTFSVAFKEAAFDESKHARRVARALGTRHHELPVTEANATEFAIAAGELLDEPFADASAIPTHFLSRYARQHVKAVLSGEGADELFAGSPWHRHRPRLRVGDLSLGEELLVPTSRRLFAPAQLAALYRGRFSPARPMLDADLLRRDGLAQRLLLDYRRYLPSDLLVKADRFPMRHGLEVRVPFLNRAVAELAISLPSSLKLFRGERKYILKRAFARHLPAETLRRPKQGFSIPLDQWLWQPGKFRDCVEAALRDRGPAWDLFRPRAIETLFREHDRIQARHGYRIWSLFVLDQWLRAVPTAGRSPHAEQPRSFGEHHHSELQYRSLHRGGD